jgi:hypothetical protein
VTGEGRAGDTETERVMSAERKGRPRCIVAFVVSWIVRCSCV